MITIRTFATYYNVHNTHVERSKKATNYNVLACIRTKQLRAGVLSVEDVAGRVFEA